jgi:hypothetical protein
VEADHRAGPPAVPPTLSVRGRDVQAERGVTEDQENKLIDVLQHTEHEKLSQWERDRLEEWGPRYEEDPGKFFLSPKQWFVIERIYEKIYGIQPTES